VSRHPLSPETSSTNLSRDPYKRKLRSVRQNENNTLLSLEQSSTTAPSIRHTETVPAISSAGNAVVNSNDASESPHHFKMLYACSELSVIWGSNFRSVLAKHERISDEIDEYIRRNGLK